jgi:histidine triad (HIT) family protein
LQVKDLAISLRKATNAKRIGYVVEGFGVEHVHIHLIPINAIYELDHRRAYNASKEDLEEMAENIKNAIK